MKAKSSGWGREELEGLDVGDARRNEQEKTLVTRSWGGPGYWPPQTVVGDVPVVQSTLCVFFKDAASGRRVYQVTANRRGEGSSLQAAMSYLICGAFAQFPVESGRSPRVTLPLDPNDK